MGVLGGTDNLSLHPIIVEDLRVVGWPLELAIGGVNDIVDNEDAP